MTQEEKAKAYDEALEKAKKYLSYDDADCDPEVKMTIRAIIPELAESDDERMLREFNDWLCEEIECRTNDLRDEKDRRTLNMLCYILTKVKDWLEKQKENYLGKYSEEENLAYRLNWVMQDYYKAGKDDEEREHRFKCYQLFWDSLEDTNFFKQKEQKLDDLSLDKLVEFFEKTAKQYDIDLPHRGYDIYHLCKDLYNFIYTYLPVLEQKPVEWSEKDKRIMQTIIKDGDLKPSEIAWLKSLHRA